MNINMYIQYKYMYIYVYICIYIYIYIYISACIELRHCTSATIVLLSWRLTDDTTCVPSLVGTYCSLGLGLFVLAPAASVPWCNCLELPSNDCQRQ